MRFGVIGRTKVLIDAARSLVADGHELVFVYTCRSEQYYGFGVDEYEAFANEMKVPFCCDLKINHKLDWLRECRADVCISLNWMTLLRQDLFDLFPHGILNAHGGDLPRYRGNACINWAILNGEKQSCMSIHEMTPELDAGPVYLKRYFPLQENTYVGDYYEWSESVIPCMFRDAIAMISGGISPVPQDTNIVPFRCFPRRPEDSRINWNFSAKEIYALIRASSHPFEGAFCYTENDEHLSIYKAFILRTDYRFSAIPGQICVVDNSVPFVACADDDRMIGLLDFSLEGLDKKHSISRFASSLRNRLH